MARKVTKLAPAQAAALAENDLDVLHPERQLRLFTPQGQRLVTVREYAHIEWLRLLPRAEPMVAAIAAVLATGREPTYEEALAVLAQHIDALAPLVMQAADLPEADFNALPPDDGELLLMTWWGCNGRFFVRRALNRVAVQRAEQGLSAGARSMPPSSTTATAPTP